MKLYWYILLAMPAFAFVIANLLALAANFSLYQEKKKVVYAVTFS